MQSQRWQDLPTCVLKNNASQLSGSNDKELKQLKTSLSIAQAEAEVLRSEKSQLQEQLSQQEAQVRMEIAQDMEEQMRIMREQYNDIIDNLKSQVQSIPLRSEGQSRSSGGGTHGQGRRMRRRNEANARSAYCRSLKEQLDKAIRANEEQLLQLTSSHKEAIAKLEATMEELKVQLKSSREDYVKLEKSKKEMMESYERLIREEDEEESSEDEEESEGEEADPTPVRHGREQKETAGARPLPSSRTSKVAVQSLGMENVPKSSGKKPSRSRQLRSKRMPFAPVPINENPASEDSGETESYSSGDSFGPDQWLRPRKPVERDESTGSYLRPRGRAPSGREWDEKVGAWRLSIAG